MNQQQGHTRFLQLLQAALGTRQADMSGWTLDDWVLCRQEARKHALVGVCAAAIEACPDDVRLKWLYSASECIERNKHLNQQCLQLARKLNESGYGCCVLKGQAVARHYPRPEHRQSGDIDIWVAGGRDALVAMTRRVTGRVEEVVYHHTDFGVFPDTGVELHFTPSWMCCPWHNRRLQKWFAQYTPTVLPRLDEIPAPPVEFEAVYILQHIFRHVFDQGVGLRQVVDYFYVLQHHYQEYGKSDLEPLFQHLGLLRFARGLMWLMGDCLLMPAEWMLAHPDRKVGEWLWRDMERAGNFGYFDEHTQEMRTGNRCTRLLWRLHDNFRRFTLFPTETLFDLPWRVCHYLWRRRKGYVV